MCGMELAVQKREKFGKAVNALRKQGLIPAELYGKGVENLHLVVPAKELAKLLKQSGESSMISVVIDGQKKPVMIQEVVYDAVSDKLMSVDFYQVNLNEKIKVSVPLEFVGESLAVKDKEGILVKAMQEVEIESLPTDIPKSISVDISVIADIGQAIRVKDLVVPSGVKVLADAEGAVATATAKMTEEQEAKLSEAVKPEDVKAETEEKVEARAAEKTATTPAGEAAPVAKPAAEKK